MRPSKQLLGSVSLAAFPFLLGVVLVITSALTAPPGAVADGEGVEPADEDRPSRDAPPSADALVIPHDEPGPSPLTEDDPDDLEAQWEAAVGYGAGDTSAEDPGDREPEAGSALGGDATVRTPIPTDWRTSPGRDCRRRDGRVVCDGPLRVAAPFGPAAELARTLGLDDEGRVGQVALNRPPEGAWQQAVQGRLGDGLLWPVREGRLWRGFGRHRVLVRGRGGRIRQGSRTRHHRGVDIGAAAGSPIRAVNDGLVLYSFNGMRGYGNSVVILHADGRVSLYAHCRATYVFAGQQVRRGQVIAEVGHTGLAHGDHLHFEWRQAGVALNPLPHFVGREEAPRRPLNN